MSVLEQLFEADHPVELGDDDINRRIGAQALHRLVEPQADGSRIGGRLFRQHGEQFVHADGDDDTVDRLAERRPRICCKASSQSWRACGAAGLRSAGQQFDQQGLIADMEPGGELRAPSPSKGSVRPLARTSEVFPAPSLPSSMYQGSA